MSDVQPTEQPQASTYPGFTVTAEGLLQVHQEIGRLFHQSVERDLHAGKVTLAGHEVVRTAQEFAADHGPEKCRPIAVETNGHAEMPEMPSGPTPIKAAGHVRGG